MCGLNAIFAYHDAAPPPSERELIATREHMAARGPDGAGAWWSAEGRLALGHRRLAVIDPDPRSAQPMTSACGRHAIAFNGEIYNHAALAADLRGRGVAFRTASDTEVLLALLMREGAEGLARARGMFALAFWDGAARALWLARDSYGIKPLYLADDGWTLRAASQVRALMAGGGISRDPEPAGLAGFHLWGAVPEPFTLYRAVRAVPPGHAVRVGALGPGEARPFLPLGRLYRGAAPAPPDPGRVRAAVTESVGRHLVADVPVGLFLSAGVDSAALLAAIEAAEPGRAAETTAVTVGFGEFRGDARDEVPLAARQAGAAGARHVVRMVGEAEFRSELPRILAAMDQPSIDGINTWFVAKAAAEAGLTVALSGIGGDELFAGYPSFRAVPRWRRLLAGPARVPGLGAAWRRVAGLAGGRAGPKIAGLLAHGGSWAGAYLLKRGLFLPHELGGLMPPGTAAEGLARLAACDPAGRLLADAPSDAVGRVSLLESGLYMRHQLLRDADWAAMAHSVEVRTPLVDVALLSAIRPMQPGLAGKAVLARAFGLPDAVAARPKTGFATPVETWMRRAGHVPPEDHWPRAWARRLAALDRGAAPAPARMRAAA